MGLATAARAAGRRGRRHRPRRGVRRAVRHRRAAAAGRPARWSPASWSTSSAATPRCSTPGLDAAHRAHRPPDARRPAVAGRAAARRRGLPRRRPRAARRPAPPHGEDVLRVAVVRLPRLSNFTDLDALAAEPGVARPLRRPRPRSWPTPTSSCCPARRATVADLALAARAPAWPTRVRRHAAAGGPVLGICGGYQMLGPHDHRRRRVRRRHRRRARPAADATVTFARGEDAGPPGRGRRSGSRCAATRSTTAVRRPSPSGAEPFLDGGPGRRGVRHHLARRAGERRLPPGLPRRGRAGRRPPVRARAGHRRSPRSARPGWTRSATWSPSTPTPTRCGGCHRRRPARPPAAPAGRHSPLTRPCASSCSESPGDSEHKHGGRASGVAEAGADVVRPGGGARRRRRTRRCSGRRSRPARPRGR